MRERFKEEFQNRYGEGLTDEELRVAAREEMIGRMQAQLKEEGIDVNGVTGVMEEMTNRNGPSIRGQFRYEFPHVVIE